MAQAFEGALAALHRVAEERADDCADEVERHRCAGARASAVRAVGRCKPVATPAPRRRAPPRRRGWRGAPCAARCLTPARRDPRAALGC
jgi:hypothetical protein